MIRSLAIRVEYAETLTISVLKSSLFMLLPINFLLSFLKSEILSVILDIWGWFIGFFALDSSFSSGFRSTFDLSVSPASDLIAERAYILASGICDKLFMGYLASFAAFCGDKGLAIIYYSYFLSLEGAFLNILTSLLTGLISLFTIGFSTFYFEFIS